MLRGRHLWQPEAPRNSMEVDINMSVLLPQGTKSAMDVLAEKTDSELPFPSSSSLTGSDCPYSPPHSMHWLEYLAWAFAFGVLVAVSIIGNSLVVWAVVWNQRMRTVTNYFLVNLALADLLMASFNVVFNCIYMMRSDWIFGSNYCTFNNFMAYLTVAASVFTLVAISADRYTAIINPLKPRMSKAVAMLIILFVWASGSVLSLPNLLYSDIYSFRYGDGSLRTICFLQWPDGPGLTSTQDYMYNIVFLIITYVIPMSVITFAYIKMGRELWGSKGIGECCHQQVTNIKSKRRVVRMFIIVVTMFGVCWLPYHMYFLVQAHLFEQKYVQHLYLAFYWLAMNSTVYSPIIYFRMNSRYHAYFTKAGYCCRMFGKDRPADSNSNNMSLHSASSINNKGPNSPPNLGKCSSIKYCRNYQSPFLCNEECNTKRTRPGSAKFTGSARSPKSKTETRALRPVISHETRALRPVISHEANNCSDVVL